MIILALDSSGPACSAALWRDGTIVAQQVVQNGNTHSQQLMPIVEQVLAYGNCALSDVDVLACVTGPGSFTGVRIGVCAARALAMGQRKPLVPVTALEAHSVTPYDGVVCALIDARHDQAYCAAYRDGTEVVEAQARMVDDFLNRVKGLKASCLFVGDGAPVYREKIEAALGASARIAPAHSAQLSAAQAAVFAAAHPERAQSHETVLPCYLRASQAEREHGER